MIHLKKFNKEFTYYFWTGKNVGGHMLNETKQTKDVKLTHKTVSH